MRPVRLNASEDEWRSWVLFVNIIKEFQSGDSWKGRRNKIKALREALRAGRDDVIYFRKAYGDSSDPHQSGQETIQRKVR